jgi:hypothetical protein
MQFVKGMGGDPDGEEEGKQRCNQPAEVDVGCK